MNRADRHASALGFASWVFTERGKTVTLFEVLVLLAEGRSGEDPADEPTEADRK